MLSSEVCQCIGGVANSTFDANSILTLKNAGGALTSYTWDKENHLVGVQEAVGSRSTYPYSQDGARRLAQSAADSRLDW